MLMSLDEVTENLGVSRVTIYKLMNQNKFPKSVKLGARTFWRRSDIEAYVEGL